MFQIAYTNVKGNKNDMIFIPSIYFLLKSYFVNVLSKAIFDDQYSKIMRPFILMNANAYIIIIKCDKIENRYQVVFHIFQL